MIQAPLAARRSQSASIIAVAVAGYQFGYQFERK